MNQVGSRLYISVASCVAINGGIELATKFYLHDCKNKNIPLITKTGKIFAGLYFGTFVGTCKGLIWPVWIPYNLYNTKKQNTS